MRHYVKIRLLQLIPIIFGLTILVYGLMYISPGDPATKKLLSKGVAVSEETIALTREEMGLNRPFLIQYADWCKGLIRGDLGKSYKDDMPVSKKLWDGFKKTLFLALSALALSIIISVPLGIYTAVRQNTFSDYLIRFCSFVGNSIPHFLISVLLMYFLCIKVRLFPIIAKGSFVGLFLPAITLSIPIISRFIRQIRAQVLEELSKPYVEGARARGTKEKLILFKDVLHNSMSAIVTLVGLSISGLLGGSVVVESIFMWPGLGKLAMDSITARDYPTIQGFVIFMAIVYVIFNLLTDITYHYLDPRIDGK